MSSPIDFWELSFLVFVPLRIHSRVFAPCETQSLLLCHHCPALLLWELKNSQEYFLWCKILNISTSVGKRLWQDYSHMFALCWKNTFAMNINLIYFKNITFKCLSSSRMQYYTLTTRGLCPINDRFIAQNDNIGCKFKGTNKISVNI